MPPFDIYFADLNQSTQEAYLEFAGLKSAREANLDVFPLTTLEAPEPELKDISLRVQHAPAKAKPRRSRDAR